MSLDCSPSRHILCQNLDRHSPNFIFALRNFWNPRTPIRDTNTVELFLCETKQCDRIGRESRPPKGRFASALNRKEARAGHLRLEPQRGKGRFCLFGPQMGKGRFFLFEPRRGKSRFFCLNLKEARAGFFCLDLKEARAGCPLWAGCCPLWAGVAPCGLAKERDFDDSFYSKFYIPPRFRAVY